jgi:hypothetical protein
MNSDPCALYEALRLLKVEPAFKDLFRAVPTLGDHLPQRTRPQLIELAPNPPAHLQEEALREAHRPGVYPEGMGTTKAQLLSDLQSHAWEAVTQALSALDQELASNPELSADPEFKQRRRDVSRAKALTLGHAEFIAGRGVVHAYLPASRCRCRRRAKP